MVTRRHLRNAKVWILFECVPEGSSATRMSYWDHGIFKKWEEWNMFGHWGHQSWTRKLRFHILPTIRKQRMNWKRHEATNSQSSTLLMYFLHHTLPPKHSTTALYIGDQVFRCLSLWGAFIIQTTTSGKHISPISFSFWSLKINWYLIGSINHLRNVCTHIQTELSILKKIH